MESTVSPERKLMALTLITPMASSTGLMITPPPMPQMPPTADAARQTRKINPNTIHRPSRQNASLSFVLCRDYRPLAYLTAACAMISLGSISGTGNVSPSRIRGISVQPMTSA